MTLPRPEPLFDTLQSQSIYSSPRKNELTHVSEVLAESGIPVSDSLQERMFEELAVLIEDEYRSEHEREPRCSA